LIVMGTTGGSNFSKRFFGSNTSNLIKRIEIPILAVPSGAKWQGWNHTLLAADFIPIKTGSCYQRLKKLTNGMPVHVEILHVITSQEPLTDYARFESEMIDSVKSENLQFHYQPGESVVDGILHYTKDHPCDVIVMLKRKHGFLEQLFVESATRKMTLHTKNPILILQE
jgi:Universal stress protein family